MKSKQGQLEELNAQIRKSKRCCLSKSATQAVPGEGPADAKIMLIGQGPGRTEDRTGRPFCGITGVYLDAVLRENSLERSKIFITSIEKFKTPGNRKPSNKEIAACLPLFLQQLELIRPKIVVLMGEVAIKNTPKLEGITYVETCHPSAAKRFPKMRKKFERDLERVALLAEQL